MVYEEIFSVSQLTRTIKQTLERSFPEIAVRGEVSNLRKQASGHIYFTLKDAQAQLSAALFRASAAGLSTCPVEGEQIIAYGQLNVYPPRGNYQMIVRRLEYVGTGELLKRLHDLKHKLEKLGWFAQESKKRLPYLPRTIGVITSPTGSVIQDILNILGRRFAGFHLLLYPVRVQGSGAAVEIANALGAMDKYQLADVLIVGRGGGSLEDLWPFNEEIVARAIRQCQIPIISAVGHETDFTIADFTADLRAPTPSAAAELAVRDKTELLQSLSNMQLHLAQLLRGQLNTSRAKLQGIASHLLICTPSAFLGSYFQKVDDLCEALTTRFQTQIREAKLKLEGLAKQKRALNPLGQLMAQKRAFAGLEHTLSQLMVKHIASRRERVHHMARHLEAIDPKNLLKKGYSITFSKKTGLVILHTQDAAPGEELLVQVANGRMHVTVNGGP